MDIWYRLARLDLVCAYRNFVVRHLVLLLMTAWCWSVAMYEVIIGKDVEDNFNLSYGWRLFTRKWTQGRVVTKFGA